jgi:hypothetical protein
VHPENSSPLILVELAILHTQAKIGEKVWFSGGIEDFQEGKIRVHPLRIGRINNSPCAGVFRQGNLWYCFESLQRKE